MATLATIDIKLSKRKSTPVSAASIIRALLHHGWSITNYGKILYLPLGDQDDFDWQEDALNESAFYTIVEQKEKKNEIIGVGLTWQNTSIGGTMLINSAFDISFSLTMNRKRFLNNITDVNWYLEKVLPCLETDSMTVEQFRFSQD